MLLLAGLWVAAMRVGLPYHLHALVGMDVAIWGTMPFVWLGLLGLAWHALPQLRTSVEGVRVEIPAVSPGHTVGSPKWLETWTGWESQPPLIEKVRRYSA